MAKHSFELTFRLPPGAPDPETHLDALYKAGCDDASAGIARQGRIGLDFAREAPDEASARASAVADVLRAIPGAALES